MKKMKSRKLISFLMAFIMICSIVSMMPITASAADSTVMINIAPTPCSSSTAPLPDGGNPVVGDTYYLNIASPNIKLDKVTFWVKAPGSKDYTYIGKYEPSGYFKWSFMEFSFQSPGHYEFRFDIQATNGFTGSGGVETDVAPKQTPTQTPATDSQVSAVKATVSSYACEGNLSDATFTEYQVPRQGDHYYLNLACVRDIKLSKVVIQVKAPGQNSFKTVYQYSPNSSANFCRWIAQRYYFSESGTYTVRFRITTTTGIQDSADLSFDVAAREATTELMPVWPCATANYISTMYRYYNGGKPSPHKTRSNMYNAIDIAGSSGDSIYAIESGTVVEKGYQKGGFGYYVVVEHSGGVRSLYGHLKSEAVVNKGDTVSRQQVIGSMGSTGDSSGDHLHFEMYNPNDYSIVINPWKTYYEGKVNVVIGGNSWKANCNYRDSDLYAAEWCSWLESCLKNRSGDYEFSVGSTVKSNVTASVADTQVVANTCDYIVNYITDITKLVGGLKKNNTP